MSYYYDCLRQLALTATPAQAVYVDDPLLAYSPTAFMQYNTPQAANGSYLRYHNDDGDYYELTVPAAPAGYAPYRTAAFGGYVDPNGAEFAATRNGQFVGNGTQEAASVGTRFYFTFPNLQPGDVLRLTKTGNGTRPAASLINDLIRLS